MIPAMGPSAHSRAARSAVPGCRIFSISAPPERRRARAGRDQNPLASKRRSPALRDMQRSFPARTRSKLDLLLARLHLRPGWPTWRLLCPPPAVRDVLIWFSPTGNQRRSPSVLPPCETTADVLYLSAVNFARAWSRHVRNDDPRSERHGGCSAARDHSRSLARLSLCFRCGFTFYGV